MEFILIPFSFLVIHLNNRTYPKIYPIRFFPDIVYNNETNIIRYFLIANTLFYNKFDIL